MLASWRNLGPRRAGLHVAAGLLVAIAGPLGTARPVRADSDCVSFFEKWSKVSAARMRMQAADGSPQASGAPQQEACMPSEAVRVDLLQGLAKARSACEGAPWLDQSSKQTKELIDINASFIGSVTLCRPDPRPAEPASTEPAQPRSIPAPRARACLDILRLAPQRYALANRKCSGAKVLAVIEKEGPSGKIECKGYTIERRLAVATLKDARPQINYECVLEQGNCTKPHLASMFPECDW